jgi:hypothetical protein
MVKPFTPERLANIRRMRKARRLYGKQPLFAYSILCMDNPAYTYNNFLDDLRYRKPPKRRKGKSPLIRFGRYKRMERLIAQYSENLNTEYLLQAQHLRKHMTKPYRVLVKINGEILEYCFSPTIPIEDIERLTMALPACKTEKEADELVAHLWNSAYIS